jgi:N-acetyl-gamma-glutamyl-phosphate reductase
LHSYGDLKLRELSEIKTEISSCDVVFCSLPHGEALKILPDIKSKFVVDLGGDFRLKDKLVYEQWYGHTHSAAEELEKWTYGLSELARLEIAKSKRIANPGCYPTASILALAPLVNEKLIVGDITIAALSGTSGAGRVPSAGLHVSHVLEDVHAYKIAKHQHTPEIEQALAKIRGEDLRVSFTAHLLPMVRGIHVTCDCKAARNCNKAQLQELYHEFYKNEKFIKIVDHNPGTKEVRGSNYVHIAPFVDERLGRIVVTAVIDNLVKGAAGQAIQNANILLGLPEDTALNKLALYP